ncbi:MAG: hypothetical protein HY975_01305, partial [Candidatus Kerfeldbacteria bacterium]|nr:hypothetical protein [Candidatus Kerfeldbacteria bacterium]
DHRYCAPNATLVADCTSICGYICPNQTTCGVGGQCFSDPILNGAPTQCNKSTCYATDGNLIKPAPAGCYASWPSCNANTILKVRKDRGCNLWLTCATSMQGESSNGSPAENLCLSLAACNSLNNQGQCNRYLPPGQCNNNALRFCANDSDCQNGGTCNLPTTDEPNRSLQDLTFATPSEVRQIANLSGNVIGGLDWNQQGGSSVVQGTLPWQLMQQIGINSQLKNGDLEFNPPIAEHWQAVPATAPDATLKVDFEDSDNSPNHVLVVQPVTQVQSFRCSNNTAKSCTTVTVTTDCGTGATCTEVAADVPFSGAGTDPFSATGSQFYYAQARIRGVNGSTPTIRMQFGYNGYSQFSVANVVDGQTVVTPTSVDVEVTAAWQRVTLGPIQGMSGQTQLAFVCKDKDNCDQFMVDDVTVKPFLQTSTTPNYLTPSCRLYPREDAPSCDYVDSNGITYKGWQGYCLERDSQTGTCLSWWPVDIIKGESNIFGTDKTAGYKDRVPLFMCIESPGFKDGEHNGLTVTNYGISLNRLYTTSRDCCNGQDGSVIIAHSDAGDAGIAGGGNTDFGEYLTVDPVMNRVFAQDLYGIRLARTDAKGGFGFGLPLFITQQTSAPTGACGNILAGRPWSACWSSSLGNGPATDTGTEQYQTIAFDFDATDGRLKGFWVFGLDGSSLGGSFWIDVQFILKEACSKVVQVVTPTGENAAFASRVGSSAFKVTDLNYGLSTDLTPFGGALSPINGGPNPVNWDPIGAEQPDYINYEVPGQARSGTPYACVGDCSDIVCTVDGSSCMTNGQIDQSKVRACQQLDRTGDSIGDGECIGVGSSVAKNLNNQEINPAVTNLSTTSATASCNVPPAPVQCTSANATPYFFDVNALCGTSPSTVAANYLGTCTSRVACQGTSAQCTGGTDAHYNGAVGTVLQSCSLFFQKIRVTCQVNGSISYQRSLGGGDLKYFAQTHLMRLFAKSYGAWYLENGRYVAQSSDLNWNPPTALCPRTQAGSCTTQSATCKASVAWTSTDADRATAIAKGKTQCQNQMACDGTNPSNALCNGQGTRVNYTDFKDPICTFRNGVYSCVGTCVSNNSYTQASTATVSKYNRPDIPNDYCAIPPSIGCAGTCESDQLASFLTSTARKATVTGGSGSVGIKFTTTADADQVPLSTIDIDWGDATDSFSYPYAPRSDASRPHVFTHVYVLNRADTTHCSTQAGRVVCDFKIRVRVKDNWGWCNNGTSADKCPDDATHQTWVDTGLTVHVEP